MPKKPRDIEEERSFVEGRMIVVSGKESAMTHLPALCPGLTFEGASNLWRDPPTVKITGLWGG